MIPYYFIQQVTEEVLDAAKRFNMRPTIWFPEGPMRDATTWVYNHRKKENLPPGFPHYRDDRGVQEIDPLKLRAAGDLVIRRTGWKGPTGLYDGPLCANYEHFTDITHPESGDWDLTQRESVANHHLLVDYMDMFWPLSLPALWGLPQWGTVWGDFDINGYQELGRLTERLAIGYPSAYQLHRPNDLEYTQERMAWAARSGKPLIVGMSPWERWRPAHGGDNKWYRCSPTKMRQVLDIVLETPNVIGIEIWSMVKKEYIPKGWMEEAITHSYQIDTQHVGALTLLGQTLEEAA